MNKEEVEVACRAYVLSKHAKEIAYFQQRSIEDFKEGANWAINKFLNDLWHDVRKEPRNDYGSIIAYSSISGQGCSLDMNELMDNAIENDYSVMWNRIVSANKFDKWFYLEDLFPKQKVRK